MATVLQASSEKGPVGFLGRVWHWGLVRHLRAIDEQYLDPTRSPDWKVLVSVYISAMVLFILNYVVLSLDFQQRLALWGLDHFGGLLGMDEGLGQNDLRLAMRITWTLGCAFLYMVIPLFVHRVVLRRPLRELGLSFDGFVRHLWIYGLLFLPVLASVVVVSYSPTFQHTYPFYRNPSSWKHLLAWELFYGLQFFTLEVFFRGFMLSELKYRLGWRSVLFMVVPYCMIHFTKPWPEALGSILAGTVLGFLALRTGSIFGGVLIHVAVAWSMDLTSLFQRGWFDVVP